MYPNPLKKKMQDGKLVLGTAIPTHDIRIATALAYSSTADFIWIDQEHSPAGTESIGTICPTADPSPRATLTQPLLTG